MSTNNLPRPLAAGNWKMNGLKSSLAEIQKLAAFTSGSPLNCDVLICPPATLIMGASEQTRQTPVQIGGQDCHPAVSGAHTGDISAQMIRDAGGTYVIVGHSERRQDHGEANADINAKAAAVIDQDLTPIICVGETEGERDRGETLDVVHMQLGNSIPSSATPENIVIAYEPVWAIGTGRTPTIEEVSEVHGAIRGQLVDRFGSKGAGVRILYGGSVKPANAAELMQVPNVNGALVGGASLKADDFIGIIQAF